MQVPGTPVIPASCRVLLNLSKRDLSTCRQLQLLRPWVTEAIAHSCTAEPNIGEMLCKELSLVFGRGSRAGIGQWRMGAWGAAVCGWAGDLCSGSAAQGRAGCTGGAGLGWSWLPVGVGPSGLRLKLRVARPDATPGPGLPRPGDGLVVLYRLLLLRVAQSWLTGAAQGRGTAIFFLINGKFAGGRYQIKGRTNTGERNLFHPAARVTARPPFARACKWYLKRFKPVSAESTVSVHDDSRLMSYLSARSVSEHFSRSCFVIATYRVLLLFFCHLSFLCVLGLSFSCHFFVNWLFTLFLEPSIWGRARRCWKSQVSSSFV